MRKMIAAMLIAILSVSLIGCVKQAPAEETVKVFFDAAKTRDTEELKKYVSHPKINALLHSTGDEKELTRMYTCLFSNFSYEILSVKEGEKEATVEVKVSNVNFQEVFPAYEKKSYDYVVDNLYSKNIEKQVLNEKCLQIYVDEVERASKSKQTVEQTLTIQLKANDYKKWDITVEDALVEAMTGGLKMLY